LDKNWAGTHFTGYSVNQDLHDKFGCEVIFSTIACWFEYFGNPQWTQRRPKL